MKGRKDLVWVDHAGVSHRLCEYEKWSDGSKHGGTWCGLALRLDYHTLRKLPATCMTCLVNAVRG